MRKLSLILLALMLAACGSKEELTSSASAAKTRIAFVFEARESTGADQFLAAAETQATLADVAVFTGEAKSLPLNSVDDLLGYDLVFIDGTTPELPLSAQDLDSLRDQTRVLVVSPVDSLQGNVDLQQHSDVPLYWANRSRENDAALIGYLASRVVQGNTTAMVPAPVVYPNHGFYHPAAGHLFATLDEYLAWYSSRTEGHAYSPSQLNVGLSDHMVTYRQGNVAVMNAMIAAIEARGANALALLRDGTIDLAPLVPVAAQPAIDVLLYDGEMLNFEDREAGLAQARNLGVPLLQSLTWYKGSAQDYRDSPGGLAPELTPRVINSERDGMLEPIVVGAKDPASDLRRYLPIPEQVEWRVERALAWARLRRADNADKRVVFTFWSEAGGKSDVGGDPDDFLDVPASLTHLLQQMQARGYDTGAAVPDAEAMAMAMATSASNIGSWAAGELAKRAAAGEVALVPASRYLSWYQTLPEARRTEIEAVWGPPPGNVMTTVLPDGEKALVIPRLEFGNVLVAPHPMWGYLEDEKVLMSKDALPPHHQYLGFFLWLQEEWRANAWVSLFSNLVLQPGKSQGPLADDHIGIMLGGLPHIHPERLGANGGVGNKRKALAYAYGWYNIVTAYDSTENLAELRAMLARMEGLDAAAAEAALPALRELLVSTGINRALRADAATAALPELLPEVSAYLDELEMANMPFGGKILGTAPTGATMTAMVAGMVGKDLEASLASLTDDPRRLVRALVAAVLQEGLTPQAALRQYANGSSVEAEAQLARALEYRDLLNRADAEVEALFAGLDGQWREPGPMGEPFRHPEVLPPGRVLYNFDQRLMPTIEAETAGVKLAEDWVAQYRQEHAGTFPDKLAMVLFSGDIAKTNGATEAQILHLLGTRAVRNWRGEVTGVELIPREELGRPRVDVLITTSGVYRDHFQDKVELIAQAAKLAAASPEADNPVSAAVETVTKSLIDKGEDANNARLLAAARVFSPAPGAYSPSIQFLAKSGEQRGDEARMAALFTKRMSHAYGAGLYGEYSENTFQENLGAMDAALLPRTSDVNGLLDNPMPAGFLGGLNLAAKAVTGNETPLYVSKLQDLDQPGIATAERELQNELRTRYFNPEWLRENQAHGYDGARNFMFLTDHLDLWDSTATNMVTSADWSEVKAVFVDDKFELGMDQFFDDSNPFAHQMLLTNLMGAAQRGQWQATAEELAKVAQRLVQSVADNGPACEANQCRNPAMTDFIGTALAALPDAAPMLAAYVDSIAQAVTAPASASTSAGAAPAAAPEVTGRSIEEVSLAQPTSAADFQLQLWALGALGLLLLGAGWWRGGQHSQFTRRV